MNINGVAVQAYPDIIKACVERKWEFVGHGYTQRNMQKVENERADIRKSAEVIEKAPEKRRAAGSGPASPKPGRRPTSWPRKATITSPTGCSTISRRG